MTRTIYSYRQKQLNKAHQKQLLKRNEITSIRSRRIIDLITYFLHFVIAHQTIRLFSSFQCKQNFSSLSLMRIESTNETLRLKHEVCRSHRRSKKNSYKEHSIKTHDFLIFSFEGLFESLLYQA